MLVHDFACCCVLHTCAIWCDFGVPPKNTKNSKKHEKSKMHNSRSNLASFPPNYLLFSMPPPPSPCSHPPPTRYPAVQFAQGGWVWWQGVSGALHTHNRFGTSIQTDKCCMIFIIIKLWDLRSSRFIILFLINLQHHRTIGWTQGLSMKPLRGIYGQVGPIVLFLSGWIILKIGSFLASQNKRLE